MSETQFIRRAIVSGADSPDRIAAYLPALYRVIPGLSIVRDGRPSYVVEGLDSAGWTLDGYVIPRLASGLMFAEEISADELGARVRLMLTGAR